MSNDLLASIQAEAYNNQIGIQPNTKGTNYLAQDRHSHQNPSSNQVG